MYIYGVDIGLYGAIVCIDGEGDLVSYETMPRKTIVKGGGSGSFNKKKSKEVTTIDIKKLADIVYNGMKPICDIVIEDVNASPQMGVSSSFKFGVNLGVVEGIMEYAYLGQDCVYKVTPTAWTRMVKDEQGDSAKKRSYNYFKNNYSEIYKKWKKDFTKKEREGLIDAFLIAQYYRRGVINE